MENLTINNITVVLNSKTYILITVAYNEEAFIRTTIDSVLNQTVRPKLWYIVNDGSADSTEEIILNYSEKFDFIHYIRLKRKDFRSFESKANAFNKAITELNKRDFDYDYICNLDADIDLEHDYFEQIINKFEVNTNLGIAGGEILELYNGVFLPRRYSPTSVSGAIQFFSKECFSEDVKSYLPLKYGGIDAAAEIMAKMGGWEVKTFSDIKVRHLRRIGKNGNSVLIGRMRYGMRDHGLGYHPIYMFFKAFSRLNERPAILGSLSMLFGYFYATILRSSRVTDYYFVKYVRSIQIRELSYIFRSKVGIIRE